MLVGVCLLGVLSLAAEGIDSRPGESALHVFLYCNCFAEYLCARGTGADRISDLLETPLIVPESFL